MRLNKRTVFLLDGIGAALSALSTGIVLPNFSNQLGIPPKTLYLLTTFPLLYFFFSLSCYFLVQEIRKWMLGAILLGNGLYCIISVGIIVFSPNMNTYGTLVLTLEILVVIVVMWIEFTIYRSIMGNTVNGNFQR